MHAAGVASDDVGALGGPVADGDTDDDGASAGEHPATMATAANAQKRRAIPLRPVRVRRVGWSRARLSVSTRI
jgi:hypothetical protein